MNLLCYHSFISLQVKSPPESYTILLPSVMKKVANLVRCLLHVETNGRHCDGYFQLFIQLLLRGVVGQVDSVEASTVAGEEVLVWKFSTNNSQYCWVGLLTGIVGKHKTSDRLHEWQTS